MGEGDPLYWATHLGLGQWNNIADDSRVCCSCNQDLSNKKRESAYAEVISFLCKFMAKRLTARQYEIMRMYHLDYHLTQEAIAQVLGITQPTVSQHLKGKKRNGKSVGGAYRRIRKEVRRIANRDDLRTEDERILRFLLSLGRPDTSFRQRDALL